MAASTHARDALAGALAAAGANHERLADLGRRLAEAEVAVAVAEERWLELADDAEAAGLDVG